MLAKRHESFIGPEWRGLLADLALILVFSAVWGIAFGASAPCEALGAQQWLP